MNKDFYSRAKEEHPHINTDYMLRIVHFSKISKEQLELMCKKKK